MKLKIKDKKTGIIYTNDMSDDNKCRILSINFYLGYTKVRVQRIDRKKYFLRDLTLSPLGQKPYWIDIHETLIDGEGEWVK